MYVCMCVSVRICAYTYKICVYVCEGMCAGTYVCIIMTYIYKTFKDGEEVGANNIMVILILKILIIFNASMYFVIIYIE